MPIGDFQDFQERYYKTISQIAVKAVNIGSLSFDDHDNSLDFFIGDEFDDELGDLESLREMAIAANIEADIADFKFGLGNPLLEKAENMKIFQYFRDIDNGEKVEIDISTLDIPDISKQEIQAQGFVNAFDNMKENGRDPVDSVKFQKYYQNVQSLSMQSDLLEVENPELSASLDRANGIFDSFNKVYAKVYAITPDKSNVGDMLNKAEKAYELQQSNDLKEQLARNILAVARVSPERITDIMKNPEMAKAKEAIMKRAENTLKRLGVNEKDIAAIGPTNAFKNVKDQELQDQIKMQSEELIAQVGRVSSSSMDSQDMRGRENLHEKYQEKASKLGKATFDKNVVEALKYEKTKDDRGKGGTIAYNAFFRKPLQLLNALRPKDDKPFFTPGRTAIAGLVALAVLAPPLGAIVGIALMCKAAKNKFYDDTKLQSWVNDKLFDKPPEKEGMINEGALDKVSVKSLIPEKTQNLDKSTVQDKAPEKDQNLDKLEVPAKSFDKPRDKLQEMIDSNPELRRDFEKVVSTAVQSSQQREEVLKVTKEIAGKDASGKQRPMDDLDLMSAKSRVSNEARKHKGSDIGR